MPVWIVTGASGFLGRHVLKAISGSAPSGVDLVAVGRRPASVPSGVCSEVIDLEDRARTIEAIASISPAVVFHLAGRTPPATAEELYRSNTLATVHLLDALRALKRPVRVVLAGSAAELGPIEPSDLPAREEAACRPADSYGLSKWLATATGLAARAPLEVVVARVFNSIGPGLPESQAFGRFAARLAAPGRDPLVLTVGDLQAKRDFIDVRDVARAMIALASVGRAGLVYHVGTGVSRRVQDGLDILIRLSGRAVVLQRESAPSRGRGLDDSRAAIDRITGHTGWRPEVPWEQSLQDLWEAACARARLPLTAPLTPV